MFTEPVAAACEILEQIDLSPTDRVLVVGDGKMGLLVVQVLAKTGAMVSLLGKHPENFRRIKDHRIVRIPAQRYKPRPVFDIAVEVSGSPTGWDIARRSLRPRGTLVLKSTYAGAFDFNPAPLVIDEITVMGSRCGPFVPAMALLAAEDVQTAGLIDGTYTLERAAKAFTHAKRRGVLKILFEVE